MVPRRLPLRRDAPAGRALAPTGRADAPAGRADAPADRALAPAGRTLAPAGRTLAPAGRALAPAGRTLALDPLQPKRYQDLSFALCQTKQYVACIQWAERCQRMATSSDVQAGCLRNQSRREWLSGKRRTAIATIGRALLLPDPASRVNEQLASAYNSGSGIPCCEFPSLPK